MADQLFEDRTLVIATMKDMEKVIAPLLVRALGVKIIIPENFDTIQYGTFSEEIERQADQVEAARIKAKAACQACPHSSEGKRKCCSSFKRY
jgi:hypothetical protein